MSDTANPSPVPLFLELGVAAAGGLVILAAPRATLLVQEFLRDLRTSRPHASRATALR